MKIWVTSVPVDDQKKALEFYTEVLGFKKKHDVPLGQDRWLTVTSPNDENGVELLLDASSHPAVPPFKEAMVKDGIPVACFSVDNIELEYAKLEKQGVQFIQPPVAHEGYITAIFDDTCGNLIQIIEMTNENQAN